jgi:hypothetical protein
MGSDECLCERKSKGGILIREDIMAIFVKDKVGILLDFKAFFRRFTGSNL